MCGNLTDFLVEQECQSLVVLKTSNGIVRARPGVGGNYIFTFFYLFYCLHQIIITHIRYYGFVTIYFARMEHCTCIGKALKLHLKILSFAKTEPSAMNENRREGKRLK